MHARMFVIQAAPDRLDEAIRLLHERSADVRSLPGFQHGHLLVDRQRGELVTLTLWASEQAMNDAQPQPRQYEVAFNF